LKLKAAMTRPLVPFCVFLLGKYPLAMPNATAALRAGKALGEFLL